MTNTTQETNPLLDPHSYHSVSRPEVELDDPRLGRITRLRLLTDPGFPWYDLSYCHGELKDGTPVRVNLPRYQFGKRNLKGDLLLMCREAGVYAKGLGLFDAISTLR
jgi:hypothetical protein